MNSSTTGHSSVNLLEANIIPASCKYSLEGQACPTDASAGQRIENHHFCASEYNQVLENIQRMEDKMMEQHQNHSTQLAELERRNNAHRVQQEEQIAKLHTICEELKSHSQGSASLSNDTKSPEPARSSDARSGPE